MTAGKLAAARWAEAQGLRLPPQGAWHVEVSLGLDDAPLRPTFDEHRETRLRIEIYSEEWGVFFCHQGRSSWIRVTDIAFVHGRDDFRLLPSLPSLAELGRLVHWIERQQSIVFRRDHALIRTNVDNAQGKIREWLATL